MSDLDDCGRKLCLLIFGGIVERGYNWCKGLLGNHKNRVSRVLKRFVEVGIVDRRGREDEEMVWSEIVLWG